MRHIGNQAVPTSRARFLLAAVGEVAGQERLDVIDLETLQRVDTNPYQPGVQSIPAPGARGVMDYFRQ